MMLAKSLAMDTRQITGRDGEFCREAATLAADEPSAEQIRRRAARWHAWLKSPECTFQDRENFERWCADVTNAAAYVEFCGDLTAIPDLAEGGEESGDDARYATRAFASLAHSPRLDADPR
jgi:ferric-dicitrate binding protein FerR (iron transport regulator)